MKALLYICFLLLSLQAPGQRAVTGWITDRKGSGIPYANIYFEGSYDGATSDTTGYFALQTTLSAPCKLIVSSIGYETFSMELGDAAGDTVLHIQLKEKLSELNEVVITAGVFSASDKKKSVTLNSFDISTTPSAVGDIYGAFASLPGSQKVGEEGMLFVRGGESYETRTYMDGMPVQSPYFSHLPQIPTRGRFSPLLFSETVFSTGGYSAEYGNALSSIVDLTTNGLETEDKASVGVMSVGANASYAKRWKNTSLAMTGLYANNTLHNMLFKSSVDWIRDPVLADGMLMFRQKVGETGLMKSFCSFNTNSMEMNYDNFEAGTTDRIRMKNNNLYANTTYTGELGDHWLIRTGISCGVDREDLLYVDQPIATGTTSAAARLAFTHLTGKHLKIRMGGEINGERYRQEIPMEVTYTLVVDDLEPALFLEPEIRVSERIALRTGVRAEYSTLLKDLYLHPRISAALKTGKYSQVSMAWGTYSQRPENDILKFAPGLDAELSDHYLLNFQYRTQTRTFRAEAYYKTYSHLVKYLDPYSPDPSTYNNLGSGYARGLDIFWRDKESLKGVDYWISYSFLDTKRDYQDYPESAMPYYASRHNLSVVYKQLRAPISTYVGATYSFASGRPYDDKNSSTFMSGTTRAYHDLSLNVTYLTRIFGKQCVIHMNVTNLLGFKNVFGYLYSETPGEDGQYARRAVVPNYGRQAILVFLVTLN